MDKTTRREEARRRARFAPRGGVSDRRPVAVREDRGQARRLVRVLLDNSRARDR
jgi:hypothetical protein